MTGKLGISSWSLRRAAQGAVVVAGFYATACFAAQAMAGGAEVSAEGLDLWTMGTGLVGGMALFLFGIEQMADSLKALAGDRLKDILAKLTTNRYLAALTGAVVTAIIQSSTVTTVLTVGFISAGILSVSQSVGIIFGSNIGSTVTAQLIAFKITELALPLVAAGYGMLFVSRRDKVRQYGAMIMGVGLLFFGMAMMSGAMKPLRSYGPFLDLMVRMETPALGIAVAMVFTGLIHSSAATTGVVIAMAGQGLITLNAGIALAFGANVGTCVTAMLAAVGKPRAALRASLIHLLFNVIGVLLWVWFIDPLADLVRWISPTAEGLSGAAKLAAETPRQIANAHSVFNIANAAIFLPFGALFARLVEILVPERAEDREVLSGAAPEWTAVHLDPGLLEVPSIALEQTRGELARLARVVQSMVADILPSFEGNDAALADRMLERTAEVETIGVQVDEYLIQVSRRNLNQEQSEFTSQLMDVGANLAHINTLIKKDVVPLLHRKAELKLVLPAPVLEALKAYYASVTGILDTIINAFAENHAQRARDVVRAKPEMVRQLHAYRPLHYEHVRAVAGQEDAGTEIDLDLFDYIRRIYTYSESMAYTMLHGYLDQRRTGRKQKA
ncbi:MAG: Na/Pi cotransporter family protein [Gemmatimonadota bacterium]